MLNDPIAIAANSPNPALNFYVVKQDGFGSERKDPGNVYAVTINHSTSRNGDRHYIKLVKTIDATNPYSGLVSPQSASISISFAKPAFGFTNSDLSLLYAMMKDIFADDDFSVTRFLSFES